MTIYLKLIAYYYIDTRCPTKRNSQAAIGYCYSPLYTPGWSSLIFYKTWYLQAPVTQWLRLEPTSQSPGSSQYIQTYILTYIHTYIHILTCILQRTSTLWFQYDRILWFPYDLTCWCTVTIRHDDRKWVANMTMRL